ncbi:hypothetical protein KJ640_02220, partial [bacterium]|nr:hypothetical protein [bacterium]
MKSMKRCLVSGGLVVMVLLALGRPIYAGVPSLIHYQGRLTQLGSPVEGPHIVNFKIFEAETGGDPPIW